jgi:hypothetical protein
MDHDCMDYRVRGLREDGDDVLTEWCQRCGRVRYETDGVRPFAWFVGPVTDENPRGHYYAWRPHRNDPRAPEVWRHPDEVCI